MVKVELTCSCKDSSQQNCVCTPSAIPSSLPPNPSPLSSSPPSTNAVAPSKNEQTDATETTSLAGSYLLPNWKEFRSSLNQYYYKNPFGDTQWSLPSPYRNWDKFYNPTEDHPYYQNRITKEVVWELPPIQTGGSKRSRRSKRSKRSRTRRYR